MVRDEHWGLAVAKFTKGGAHLEALNGGHDEVHGEHTRHEETLLLLRVVQSPGGVRVRPLIRRVDRERHGVEGLAEGRGLVALYGHGKGGLLQRG